MPSPLYYNGRVLTVQNGGIVYSRVAKTGELVYNGRIGAMGYYYSSPVAADNKIYIASEEGVVKHLAVLNLARAQIEVRQVLYRGLLFALNNKRAGGAVERIGVHLK